MPSETSTPTDVLLVAHGSSADDFVSELEQLTTEVAERIDGRVAWGALERAQPAAEAAGRTLIAAGAGTHRTLVIVPLLLFSAYHAGTDVPELAAHLRSSAPRARVLVAPPLGQHEALLDLGERRIRAAGGADGLLIVATGSTDADAQADAERVAARLGERVSARLAVAAYASQAEPGPRQALQDLLDVGVMRITAFSWSLFDGVLASRAERDTRAAAVDRGIPLVWAGRLGVERELVEATVARIEQALHSGPTSRQS